jgi:hypothetical protein
MKGLGLSLIFVVEAVANSDLGGPHFSGTTSPGSISKPSCSTIFVRGGDDQPTFLFSEVSSEDFDSETEFFERHRYESEDFSDSTPIVASSQVLYEGCFVQSEAMLYNDRPDAILNGFDLDDFYGDSDDDEDDDDNDGHSSMLSNSSLRRSKVGADGSYSPRPAALQQPKNKSANAYFESKVILQRNSASFGIRGKTFLR